MGGRWSTLRSPSTYLCSSTCALRPPERGAAPGAASTCSRPAVAAVAGRPTSPIGWPRRLVGLDVSAAATALARRRHGSAPPLEYRQGDAEALPFGVETFDLVLNVESAHCYASIPRFLAEVHRVLRPGGELLFAGFVSRQNGAFVGLQGIFATSPLALVSLDEITDNVVASLAADEARKRALLDRWVKGPFKSFAKGAYAMDGTAMRRALQSGETAYLAAVLRKVVAGLRPSPSPPSR